MKDATPSPWYAERAGASGRRQVCDLVDGRLTHWRIVHGTWREWILPDADVGSVASPDFWRASIHMPRWASRLTLEVTEVRVQRLREISEEDVLAEGVTAADDPDVTREAFRFLWDAINGKRAPWESNPWVWAISFRKWAGKAR